MTDQPAAKKTIADVVSDLLTTDQQHIHSLAYGVRAHARYRQNLYLANRIQKAILDAIANGIIDAPLPPD